MCWAMVRGRHVQENSVQGTVGWVCWTGLSVPVVVLREHSFPDDLLDLLQDEAMVRGRHVPENIMQGTSGWECWTGPSVLVLEQEISLRSANHAGGAHASLPTQHRWCCLHCAGFHVSAERGWLQTSGGRRPRLFRVSPFEP